MAGIRQAFMLFGTSMRLLWDEIFTFVMINLLWLLLSLSIFAAPAALMALYSVADKWARAEPVRVADFWVGLRQYWFKGTLLCLFDLVALCLLVLNALFYGGMDAGWARAVQILWIALLLIWGLMQLYLFPMLVVQVQPKITVAIRNAVLMVAAQPLFTLAVACVTIALAIIGIALMVPFATIGMSAIALYTCVCLNDRLKALRQQQEELSQNL